MTRVTARILACGLALVTCSGEAQDGGGGERASADAVTPSPPAAVTTGAPDDEPRACPRARGAALVELEWIPDDVRLAVVLTPGDAQLERALGHLAEYARARPDVPIVSGLALSQLELQLTVLRARLDEVGFEPATLVLLHTGASEPVWVWRAPCDLGELRAAIEARWRLKTRTIVGGVVGEAGAGVGAPPGDVALLSGDRVALTPAGAGARIVSWLEGHGPSTMAMIGGDPPDDEAHAVARALTAIEPAPARVLMQGRALLSVGAQGPPGAIAASQRVLLRASASGVERVGEGPNNAAEGSGVDHPDGT